MQQLIIPTKGAQWKHQILNKIAKSKEFPSRLRLYNLLKYAFNISLVKTTSQSGLVLLLDIADWVQYQIYFYGNYEQKSINLFKNLSNQAQVIFDIGAHVGQYALECAQLANNKNKHIFAIEANPKTFTYLLNNIQLNNFKQIIPVLGAVSNQHQLAEMNIPAYWNLGNTQLGKNKNTATIDSYLIATYNIKTLLNKYALQEIDLIKIDIEGHEYYFFEDLFKNKIFPKKIIFEYIPKAFPNILLCVNLFKENNYKIFNIENQDFNGEEEVLEQNLLAILQ